jgi:hypothetical protein
MPSEYPPLQSQNASFDADGFEAVKTDLQQMALQVNRGAPLLLNGQDRIFIPRAGRVSCFMVANLATVSSSTAYHLFQILRSGQAESGIVVDTRASELVAYREVSLGQVTVSQGTLLQLSISVTGAPTPTLSTANIALRCELTEGL